MEAITTAMTTAFGEVQSNSMEMIASALPFALGILGTVLAIGIGINVFKKLTAKA